MEALRLIAVYLSACGAAAWLAHRLILRITLPMASVLVALPLLLTGRAIVTGGFYGPLNASYVSPPLKAGTPAGVRGEFHDAILNDVATQMVPWKKAVRESYKHGRFPLWNRFMFAGDVLAGAASPAPFHPATLVGCLLPLATAWTFGCAFNFFLAGLFGFLCLREIGLREAPSLFGAAAWMLSGFLVFWIGWPQAATFIPLPLLLLGLRRVARRAPGGILATAAALVLVLVGGHPESVLHVVSAAGLVFLFELARQPRRLHALGISALAGVIAVGLASPALFPYAEAIPQSVDYADRHAGYAHEKKSTTFSEAAGAAVAAVYPARDGDFWNSEPRRDRPRHSEDASGAFVGGLALVLAALGLASRFPERLALASVGLLCLLVTVATPGVTDAVVRLPLFDIAVNSRLAAITAFCLAALGAMGLQRLMEKGGGREIALLSAMGVVLAGGLWLVRQSLVSAGGDPTPLDASAIPLLGGTAIFIPLTAVLRRRPAALGGAAVGLFLVTHLAELPPLYPTFDRALFYPRVPELDRLPKGGEPYRIVGLGYDLLPNLATFYELEDVRGYEGMTHRRWAELAPIWSTPLPVWFQRVDDPSRPMISLMNVRYALGAPDRPAPAGWTLFLRGPDCALFENPKFLPRAFAPAAVTMVRPEDAVVEEMKRCEDFSRIAWIEGDVRQGSLPNGPLAALRTREEGPDLRIHVEADRPAWIVVSELAWKGWRATESGREIPLRIADHAFLGFQVPEGTHEILLRYRPRSFSLALGLNLGTMFLLAAVAVNRRRRGRTAGVAARTDLERKRGTEP